MDIDGGQFVLERLDVIMEPDPANPAEAWGVLNPGSARSPEGDLLLFPRSVAEGNFSRIERAEVLWEGDSPRGVRRNGFALEPVEPYESDKRAHGGVEDPRVTFVRPLSLYVMAYVALGRFGPRVAVAVSEDAREWRRLGLLRFTPGELDFSNTWNKDAAFFPQAVSGPGNEKCLAIFHRPMYLVSQADGTVAKAVPKGVDDNRGSIWISYIPLEPATRDITNLVQTCQSTLLATPGADWECLKIGGGAPPMLTSAGWVVLYHGASGREPKRSDAKKEVCYQAGVMVLDRDDPRKIRYRSPGPVLSPAHDSEKSGIVNNVVFPTAIDAVGQRIFVYYGAADSRVSVASTVLNTRILVPPSAPTPQW